MGRGRRALVAGGTDIRDRIAVNAIKMRMWFDGEGGGSSSRIRLERRARAALRHHAVPKVDEKFTRLLLLLAPPPPPLHHPPLLSSSSLISRSTSSSPPLTTCVIVFPLNGNDRTGRSDFLLFA